MKNTTKGNLNFSYSSTSPSFLSKIKSCFRTHKSSHRSQPPLLSRIHNGVPKASSPSTTIQSKPAEPGDKANTNKTSYPSQPPLLNLTRFRVPKASSPSTTIQSKPADPRDKANTTPSSSSSTIPSKPEEPRDKFNTTPSSSSPTIPKKPVSQHTVPPAASTQNTDPSMTQAAWTLATGAGKLVFNIGKKAALLTTGVVKIAHNQIDHIEKLKETFACYYTEQNGTAYQGTLHFSNNQIIFSTDFPSHNSNENRNPPILPPGSSYKTKESELKQELKISFREVIEINQVNAENPSTRYIQIRRVQGSNYAFGGFVDYYKAYNHIYSLLPTTSS